MTYKYEGHWSENHGGLTVDVMTNKRKALRRCNKLKNVGCLSGQRLTVVETGKILWESAYLMRERMRKAA